MSLEHRLSAAVACAGLGLCIIATAAQSAPIAAAVSGVGAAARASPLADTIASRCWWRNGRRYCARDDRPRAYRPRSQGSDYYEHIPEKLPYGSQLWWDQMLRDNRAGNPGGGGRD
jgi:hypothetical protein